MSKLRSVSAHDAWWKVHSASLSETWALTLACGRRDLRLRYAQTRLGWVWAVVQPLALITALTVVLGRVFGLPPEGLRQFGLNLAVALPGWIWFQFTVSQGASSLITNQSLVSKAAFPRTALPNAKALVGLADFGVGTLVVLVLLALLGEAQPLALLRLPLAMGYTALAALGWAYLGAALSVRRRDLLAVLPILLQVLFFISPVALPSANFEPKGLGILYWLNPAVAMADGFRWAWLGWDVLQPAHLLSAGSGILGFAVGLLTLRWRSKRLNEFM
ncbi:MAG: ABC transporter permease [Schleiferiaceae bacterium]